MASYFSTSLFVCIVLFLALECNKNIIGASLSEPHTSETFVGSSFYEYRR